MPTPLLRSGLRCLNGNVLKLIAAITMHVDHMGLLFVPRQMIFRIIGRIAFPIFAFMIAEGCHYTKNRLRYFLSVFLLGAMCQAVYLIFTGDTYLNILLTFSCAIPTVYLLQEWKTTRQHWRMIPFAAAVAACYVLNRHVEFDYGFWGMMIPVLAALSYPAKGSAISTGQHFLSIGLFGLGLLQLAYTSISWQHYSLLTLPLLLLYSGKRGKGNYKYAFYLFYPLHLAALQAIAWLLA